MSGAGEDGRRHRARADRRTDASSTLCPAPQGPQRPITSTIAEIERASARPSTPIGPDRDDHERDVDGDREDRPDHRGPRVLHRVEGASEHVDDDVADEADREEGERARGELRGRALKSPYWKKTAVSGCASTIMIAISGAARKTRIRRLPATWRRISLTRPSAASRERVGKSATATLTPRTPTGICDSWKA